MALFIWNHINPTEFHIRYDELILYIQIIQPNIIEKSTYIYPWIFAYYLLGTPDTNFKGLRTRIARRVRKSTPLPTSSSVLSNKTLPFVGSDSGSGVRIVM